jgi:nucleoredoxin
MFRGVILIFVFLSILRLSAALLPLTTNDVSLMLRSGYSSASVMRELSMRHFADALDATKQAKLVQAGASAELIGALKSGTYSVTPQEAERAKEQLAAQAKRKEIAAEESRKFNTLHQAEQARERAAAQAQSGNSDAIYKFLKGDLVRSRNGSLAPSDDESFAHKKLIAFYFSAHWCVPCRKFTPQLVEYYNRVASQHPEFEIVFFSLDKSASAMESYMRETGMPWPAIDYQKLQNKEVLRKNAGDGIPALVLVDAAGKMISSSQVGSQYFGPAKVLGDLDAIFANTARTSVATGR